MTSRSMQSQSSYTADRLDIQHLTPHLFLLDKTTQGRTASAYNEPDDGLTERDAVFTNTDSCY